MKNLIDYLAEARNENEAQIVLDLICKYFSRNFKHDDTFEGTGRLKPVLFKIKGDEIPENLQDYQTIVHNLDQLRKEIKKLKFVIKLTNQLFKNLKKDVTGYILTVTTKQDNRFDFEITCKDVNARILGDKSDEVKYINLRIFNNDELKELAKSQFE